MLIDYEKELNPEQLAAVREGDGPCVVLAGAGSGKTRTVVYRVAWLIEHGVSPDRILLLTFTNKAAAEMMGRIGSLLGSKLPFGSAGVWGGTFHSIANRLLRTFGEQIGFTRSFAILDDEDSRALMKVVMKELGFAGDKRFPSPAVVRDLISYSVNAMMPLADAILKKHPKFEPITRDILNIAEGYDVKKRNANAMDFDDLMLRLHHLLLNDPVTRERIASRWEYVLVDEYQDTNPLQASLVNLLLGPKQNLMVVGDDAQSIYSFRAADVRNILHFPRAYPGAKMFKIETNYRSVPEVLNLANDVISRNIEQFQKELRSVKPSYKKPQVVPCPSAFQEADFVVDKIRQLLQDGVKPEAIAVLFRATHHSQTVEFELMKRGIQYDYRGGVKFFDRAHVKDALTLVRIKNNFGDEVAWMRLLQLQEGIGETGAMKIFQMVRSTGSLASAVLAPIEQMAGARAGKGWADLRPMLEKLVEAVKPTEIVRIITKSAYVDYLENEFPNWRERLEDVEQLAVFAEEYDSVHELLADIALDSGVAEKTTRNGRVRRSDVADKVVLSTIHQAKGLEWDAVFVVHLTNSGFPNRKAAMEENGLEEERRLFYVAVTRAKKYLFLSYPATAGRDQFTLEQPSLFLEEANPKLLDLSLVEGRLGFAGSGNTFDDSDSGGFFNEGTVSVDDDGSQVDPEDAAAAMRERMKKVKRTFLRDV